MSRRLNLSVQSACKGAELPSRPQIRSWARAALTGGGNVTIRFVEHEEGRSLNRDFRGKDQATNVLSFVYESGLQTCGDLVLCAPVVVREACEQDKSVQAHFAHLIVHGILHLQGYDHETSEQDARRMEGTERDILASLGFDDPYRTEKDAS